MPLVSVSFHQSCPRFDGICSIDSTSRQVLLSKEWSLIFIATIRQIFCLSPLLLMCIRCQFFPSWIPFEHSNFSLRSQTQSPIKPDWSDLRDLNFDCIQFSGFRTQWCNARSSLRCPCTIDWQFSRPARLIFPSGASRPIGNIRTHRVRVETIFRGLPCRRSLTPCVSPSHAPVLSFARYFQAPATQATADIAFIMSSSQAIVNWLNALDQSDFS